MKEESWRVLRMGSLKWSFESLKMVVSCIGTSCEKEGVLYSLAARDGDVEICIWLMENRAPLTSVF